MSASLARSLGLTTATALVVGEVVGVGIFLTPATMAMSLGSPMLVLLGWIAMGVMAACGALCYGELASRIPEAGGGYAYLREAYGPLIAFLYGWKSLLVMDPGLTAALALGLASYVAAIAPMSPWAQKVVALVAIVLVAATNIRGARLAGSVLRSATLLKLALLAALAIWAFGARLGDWGHFIPLAERRSGSPPLVGALAGGFVAAFFSFGGWWDVAKIGGEVRDPSRNLPRALLLGVFVVTLIYILTSAAFLYLVPIDAVRSGEAFAAQAGEVLFGASGGRILSLIVVICVLSSLAALMMAAPRVYWAMARDGVFPHAVAKVHPRFGTPARAISLQAALAALLVLVGSFSQVVAYFIFVTVAFVGLTVGSLFIFRRRDLAAAVQVSRAEPAFRTPGFPVPAIIFLSLVMLLLLLLAVEAPLQAALGTGVMALGWPAYRIVMRQPQGAREGMS